MGNDPGPLGKEDSATVVIQLHGPLKAVDAKDFKHDLDELLDRFRPKMGELTRPIKGQEKGKKKKKK